MLINAIYYSLKPFLPRSLQLFARRQVILRKRRSHRDIWPIDPFSNRPPDGWKGWPDGKRFALLLSHDVDTAEGHEKCSRLMDIELALGFKSAFYFVPEKYRVSEELLSCLAANGFEVGVHGLMHDGKLYRSRKIFKERAEKINHYIRHWKAVGL